MTDKFYLGFELLIQWSVSLFQFSESESRGTKQGRRGMEIFESCTKA